MRLHFAAGSFPGVDGRISDKAVDFQKELWHWYFAEIALGMFLVTQGSGDFKSNHGSERSLTEFKYQQECPLEVGDYRLSQ